MQIRESRSVFSWMNPKTEVRDAGESGNGVFAKEKILKDEIISVHGGYVLTVDQEKALPEPLNDHGSQIHDNFVISSKEIEEDDGLFNHSCEPNAGYKGQIFLVAMRDIEKDEEITFDYAMVLYENDPHDPYRLTCKCGRENCRGIVTDSDWKISELRAKYNGYFQWYLQDKIDKGL